jgi:hypothetical protein
MMATKLLLGVHLHQPVDNFDWVIEHAVEVCYGPFFKIMRKYPEFRFAVHCSGWLMEQIQKGFPEVYADISYLAKKGSIEFVTAGYYEPILSVIPSHDRVTQITMLNDDIHKKFKQTPEGLWLTERVWESALIPDIVKAGVKYTVMDDYHFQCAGFDKEGLDGYYMSEEGGDEIALFPISKPLRYAIPFLSVKSAIDAIKAYNQNDDSAAIIFDDAEKFGMWPGTFEWVYEKGWLEEFVEAVLADESIETMHFCEYLEQSRPRGLAYLPNVSYYEMGEWSLRADDTLKLEQLKDEMGFERYEEEGVKFLKGGIWKNFFVKYTESNRIHKRMLELSKVRKKVKNKSFDEALYKLQTNDVLWHGVFGGLYLPNLRDNAYTYMIACEDIRYKKAVKIESHTDTMDGYEKIKAITNELIFCFDALHGGQLTEWDSRSAQFNWQNTLTRRKEAYHQQLFAPPKVQEEEKPTDGIDTIHGANIEVSDELKESLIYDWYLKHSFIDHFSDAGFNLESFKHCTFKEYGDFANQPFNAEVNKKNVIFNRQGGLFMSEAYASTLSKTFAPKAKGLDFTLAFSTDYGQTLKYVLELNLHFSEYESVQLNEASVLEGGWLPDQSELILVDGYTHKEIRVTCSQNFDIVYFPLQTLSQSEKGFDLTTQGISIALVFDVCSAFSLEGSLEVNDV